jgi:hypothetical protein
VARLEREHPGYARIDKARALRGLVQRRQGAGGGTAAPAPAQTAP